MSELGFNDDKFSTFAIIMRGTKIAFYMYHAFSGLLDDEGIENFKGFIPLNQAIPLEDFIRFHGSPTKAILHCNYYTQGINFPTDSQILQQLGVAHTVFIPHPHIFDLIDPQHREHIHNMFSYISTKDCNFFFKY